MAAAGAAQPQVASVRALWDEMQKRASDQPREQALLESFEPVGFDGAVLRVRLSSNGQGGGFAASRVSQLATMAQAALGRTVRTNLEAPAPGALRAPRVEQTAVASDDPIRTHPLVRRVAELFDATVVRIDLAGTLSTAEPTQDGAEDPSAGDENV